MKKIVLKLMFILRPVVLLTTLVSASPVWAELETSVYHPWTDTFVYGNVKEYWASGWGQVKFINHGGGSASQAAIASHLQAIVQNAAGLAKNTALNGDSLLVKHFSCNSDGMGTSQARQLNQKVADVTGLRVEGRNVPPGYLALFGGATDKIISVENYQKIQAFRHNPSLYERMLKFYSRDISTFGQKQTALPGGGWRGPSACACPNGGCNFAPGLAFPAIAGGLMAGAQQASEDYASGKGFDPTRTAIAAGIGATVAAGLAKLGQVFPVVGRALPGVGAAVGTVSIAQVGYNSYQLNQDLDAQARAEAFADRMQRKYYCSLKPENCPEGY